MNCKLYLTTWDLALPLPQGYAPTSALSFPLSACPLVPSLLFIPGGRGASGFTATARKRESPMWLQALDQKCPMPSQTLVLWPRLCSWKPGLVAHLPEHFILLALWASTSKPERITSQFSPLPSQSCFRRSKPQA